MEQGNGQPVVFDLSVRDGAGSEVLWCLAGSSGASVGVAREGNEVAVLGCPWHAPEGSSGAHVSVCDAEGAAVAELRG